MEAPLAALALVVPTLAYLHAVRSVRRRRRTRSTARTVAFLAGIGVLAVALLPPLATHDEVVRLHVIQHVLIGMVAPMFLALSAPVMLALNVLAPRRRRAAVSVLNTLPARLVSHGLTAACLSVGGMAVLYGTGLFALSERVAWLHLAVHAHFIVSGYLFAAAVVGLDPHRHRVGMLARCALVVLVFGAHETIAKLLYAHGSAGWHAGATVMWYGGDAADVLLLVALFTQWYRREGRRLQRRVPPGAGAAGSRSSAGALSAP